MYCSKCGANIAEDVAFCSACGQPVAGGSAIQAQPAVTNPAPPIAAPPLYTSITEPAWEAPVARAPVAYAGFWLRFVAVIIDGIILFFVSQILLLPFAASMGFGMRGMFNGRSPNPADFIPMFGIILRIFAIRMILNWLYYALLESSSWRATLGKKALGLEVTDLYGNRISFGRATGRFFAKIISSIILFIGYIMAGFTEKKRALHDMIAGTLVIRKL